MSINGITVGGDSREGAKDGDVAVEKGSSEAAAGPGPVFRSLRKMLAAGVHTRVSFFHVYFVPVLSKNTSCDTDLYENWGTG